MAIQLFGHDPEIMRSAAAEVARASAPSILDLNMGCPVPKVMKTGAGAAMHQGPGPRGRGRARRPRGLRPAGDRQAARVVKAGRDGGLELARRLVDEAGVAGITFHPRSAAVRHKGVPDYDLAAELVRELPVPVIVCGGMEGAEHIRWVFELHRLRGRDAGAWRAREPVAVRPGARRARRRADAPKRCSRSGTG